MDIPEIVTFLNSFEIHLFLHFAVPGAVAWLFFRSIWKKAWGIMLVTMLVDLDHLIADPIFDPARCSIGFHPLHSVAAIIGYVALTVPKKTCLIGLGLLIHMALDYISC